MTRELRSRRCLAIYNPVSGLEKRVTVVKLFVLVTMLLINKKVMTLVSSLASAVDSVIC